MHDYHIIFDVFEVRILNAHCLTSIYRITSEHVVNLLLVLALHEQFVPVVGLLVDAIEVMRVLYRHELRDRALLEDFLTPVSNLLAEHLLLIVVVDAHFLLHRFVLQTLRLEDISRLVELIFGTLVRHGSLGEGRLR